MGVNLDFNQNFSKDSLGFICGATVPRVMFGLKKFFFDEKKNTYWRQSSEP